MVKLWKMKMVKLNLWMILKWYSKFYIIMNTSKMVFNQLCPPALIYLIFSTTQDNYEDNEKDCIILH